MASIYYKSKPGSGNIDVSGEAGNAHFSISGSGNVNGFNLATGEADVNILGSGDLELTVENYLVDPYEGIKVLLFSAIC